MQRSSTALATAAVVAGLGGLAAVALNSHPGGDAAATAAATAPPRTRTVRTVEVHTITRVRRDLPPAQPRVAAAAPPPAAPAPVAAPSAPAPAVASPVARQTPVSQPLRTRASGAPGSGSGGENERSGEHESRHTEREGHGQDD